MQRDRTIVVPLSLPSFTLDEWDLHNRHIYRCSEAQQESADRLSAESNRICSVASELTEANKNESDHRLKDKLRGIENLKQELLRIRKEILLEINALSTAKENLMKALSSVKKNALLICEKCLFIRERRVGIDLVYDDVDLQLRKECRLIEKSENVLIRTLEQAHEQVRRLKATLYSMDHDLEDKDNNLQIDRHNLSLKVTCVDLSLYHGNASLEPSNITLNEWEMQSQKNIVAAAKELNKTRPMRCYIDTIVQQIIGDLNTQKKVTDNAFMSRINDVGEAKTKLELQHSEIMRQVKEMTMNITDLEKSIAEKEPYMALAHLRLGNRCQRPGFELTRDFVEISLVREVYELRDIVAKLQQSLSEAQVTLRHLLKIQIQLEEDINIKVNSLQIDAVDCITLRHGMDYHADSSSFVTSLV